MVILTPKYPKIDNIRGKTRNALRIGGIACVAVAGTTVAVVQRSSKNVGESFRLSGGMALNETVIDCISGALGEVAALYSLFPLDTLKVQCQAKSVKLSTALQHIVSKGPRSAVKLLYAGAGTAAIGGAIVGALHLSVYYYWKRIGDKIQAHESMDGMSKGGFALFGALMSSICVGAVEAPFDQVKMRAQANAIRGSPMKNLIETLTSSGARAVMSTSFVPFIMKAIPHDAGELITFTALSETDSIAEALGPFPESARDAIMGAVAGVSAAILSTPFDVICTKTNLSNAAQARGTMVDSLKAFGKNAQIEFQKGGVRAFYSGFLPRLLHMVPAGVIYWAVVESSRRALSPKRQVIIS